MRKINFPLVSIIICLLFWFSLLQAQSRSLPVLEEIGDVRSSAMGGLQMIHTTYGSYLYVNPTSILYTQERGQISASTLLFPRDKDVGRLFYSQANGSWRFLDKHVVHAGFRYMGGQHISLLGPDGEDRQKRISPFDWSLDLAYALRLGTGLSFFVQGGLIQSYVYSAARSVSFGLGANYRYVFPATASPSALNIGLRLSDVGMPLAYGKGSSYALPSALSFGTSWDKTLAKEQQLSLGFGLRYAFLPRNAQLLQLSLGGEYSFLKHFFLRAGYRYGNRHTSQITAGAAVHYASVRLDLAYLHSLAEFGAKRFMLGLAYGF